MIYASSQTSCALDDPLETVRAGAVVLEAKSRLQPRRRRGWVGVVAPAFEQSGDQEVGRIRSGTTKSANAFAAVRYRGYWFWVDDSAWTAKRALTAVMFFFTLTETESGQRVPLVTIPAR